MANWYCSSVAYTAVAQFAITHAYNIGDIVRQLAAPAAGSERCFRCTTAGTSAGAEAGWNLGKSATTAQGTATFTEITGNETYQGTGWAAPFARLQSAVSTTWAALGDTVYVSADHAETQAASITISIQSSITQRMPILCVTRPSASIPPASTDLTTGASVACTGANTISVGGFCKGYGVSFTAGDGANNSTHINIPSVAGNAQEWERSTFILGGSGANAQFQVGNQANGTLDGTYLKLRNCDVRFNAASQKFAMAIPLLWDGGSLLGTAPTLAFGANTLPNDCTAEVRNVDLSTVTANLVSATNHAKPNVAFSFVQCKLNASLAAAMTGTISNDENCKIDLVLCDSAGTVREEHYRYAGSVISDTANYLTAGAADPAGTHKALKMVSNANCSVIFPLEGPDIFAWCASTGSKVITLYCANTSGLTLKNTELGFDVEYLGSSTSPLGTLASSMGNIISAGTALATNAIGWTGLVTPVKQLATVTVTVNKAGWVRIRPVVKRASLTVWVDPYPPIV